MAISALISEAGFELIRDQIAAILAIELPNQRTLAASFPNDLAIIESFWGEDDVLNLFLERFVPVDLTEQNSINVYYENTGYQTGTSKIQKAAANFNIDLEVASKASSSSEGDKKSALYIQRMAGIIRGIIQDGDYFRLGFAPGFVSHRFITSINPFQPTQIDNANYIMGLKISLQVKYDEIVSLKPLNDLLGNDTKIDVDDYGKFSLITDF